VRPHVKAALDRRVENEGCDLQAVGTVAKGAHACPWGFRRTARRTFLDLVRRSNINIEDHPTYSQGYFETRAQTYCELLQQGEMMKLTQEITFPPVVNWSETTNDRPRLETAILRIGTLNYCNAHWSQERQWEATFTR
jgi:hypothetical protein